MCGGFSPTKVPVDKFGSLTSGSQLSPTSLASTFYHFLGAFGVLLGNRRFQNDKMADSAPPPITSSACNKLKREELFILWLYLLFQHQHIQTKGFRTSEFSQSFSSSCRINTFEIVTKLPVTLQTKKPWPTVVALDKGLHSCACFLCRPHSAKMIIHPVGRPGKTMSQQETAVRTAPVSSNVPENPKMPGWKYMGTAPIRPF